MGFCLYGNDIDDTTSVLEGGLGWITKLKKQSAFPSKEFFMQQKKNGIEKKLVGFIVDDRRVPRHGYPVCDEAGNEIGVVTSGTLSPTLQIPVGMAYVPTSLAKVGSTFDVKAGSKMLTAKVVPVPFIDPKKG
jgi:aminomethyltransferase